MTIKPATLEEGFAFITKYPPEENKRMQNMIPYNHFTATKEHFVDLKHFDTRRKVSAFFLTAGILLVLGGVFVCMASYQVIPGINVVGSGYQVLGYCMLGAGLLSLIIASIKFHSHNKSYRDELGKAFTQANFVLRCILAPKLKPNELFVMDMPYWNAVMVSYSNQGKRPWMKDYDNEYTQFGFQKGFRPLWTREWFFEKAKEKGRVLDNDISFVSLEELEKRFV